MIYAVVGSNYGDEGKGLTVDWLCRKISSEKNIGPGDQGILVSRYNGGGQAGHTVVTDETRHVFSHFGSGSLFGAHTYLGKNFICNPIVFKKEFDQIGGSPTVFMHPRCKITTYFDMMANQLIEESRFVRHGSCGIGIFETIHRERKVGPVVRIDGGVPSHATLVDYFIERLQEKAPHMLAIAQDRGYLLEKHYIQWRKDLDFFASKVNVVYPASMKEYGDIIFEGAQGLLLDQSNMSDFPHLTPSSTGVYGAVEDMRGFGVRSLTAIYVTRTYLTRHGAGPLIGEVASDLVDETNHTNEFQGSLRFAPLDHATLARTIHNDIDRIYLEMPNLKINAELMVTHVDQNVNFSNHQEDDWWVSLRNSTKNITSTIWISEGPKASNVRMSPR